MNNLYKLTETEKPRKLRQSGFKITHPFREKLFSFPEKIPIGIVASIAGSVGSGTIIGNIHSHEPISAGIGFFVGAILYSMILYPNRIDRETMEIMSNYKD